MQYPNEGTPGAVIDLDALHEQKDLQPGEELIIRLETISDKGLAEGHTLQVLAGTIRLCFSQKVLHDPLQSDMGMLV